MPPVVAPPVTPPAEPPPKPAGSVRELAARYLVSNGAGGWRPDEKAATEIERLGPEATAQFLPLLADTQVEVRRGAAFRLLETFDPASREQVAGFSGLLTDQDRTIRGIGLSAVNQMRREDQLAVLPVLTAAAASDPDPKFRSACLTTIAKAADAAEALPILTKALSDPDSGVKLVAMARLGAIGPPAASAVKDLAAALDDANPLVRNGAGTALAKIGSPSVPELAAKLGSTNAETRKVALAALAKLGPTAKDALPAVEKCLTDADPHVKQVAEAAVQRIRGE
jgi:HEAT repeat protein